MTAPAATFNLSAQLSASSGVIAIGDVLVPVSGAYVKATTANLVLAAERAHGIALSEWSSSTPGAVRLQHVGILDAATSGLAAGTASWLRVSSTGRLERCTPGIGDDIVGRCAADGTAWIIFGLFDSTNYTSSGGGSFTPPTGTGFVSVTAGSLDPASIKVNLASSTYVTGTLPAGNGGTGITSLGTGIATMLGTGLGSGVGTWMGVPSATNFESALVGTISASRVVQATGTGIPHVVAGVLAAASSLIVNADVSASAAIAVSKLAPSGTNGWVLTTTAGVPVWAAAAAGSPAGSTGELQINNAGVFGAATGVLAGAGFISITTGAAVGATGALRVDSGFSLVSSVGGVDRVLFATNTGADVVIGNSSNSGDIILRTPSGTGYIQSGGVNYATFGSSAVTIGFPIIGNVGGTSPYAVHGTGLQAMADANQIAAASVYCYRTIKTTGAITANRTLTVPNGGATDPGSREFTLRNTCTGAFSIVVSTGAGTTVTVANGKIAILGVDSGGVYRVTADT